MSNEIYIYREFWIKATKDKLIELTEELIHDARVQDFNKMDCESDISKSDAKSVVAWIDWVLPIIKPLFDVNDTRAQNRIRMMKVMREKLARRVKA